MNLSDLIEQYIMEAIADSEQVELKRSEIAQEFNCVPSQINYVISTRFIPELGFYVESKRGGNGYIKISRINLSKSDYIKDIIYKIGGKMSQRVMEVYLRELLRYNVIDSKNASIISAALSDKSLVQVEQLKRDQVRADMFKNILVNLI
jgi:transcriptional regulator CtsR